MYQGSILLYLDDPDTDHALDPLQLLKNIIAHFAFQVKQSICIISAALVGHVRDIEISACQDPGDLADHIRDVVVDQADPLLTLADC